MKNCQCHLGFIIMRFHCMYEALLQSDLTYLHTVRPHLSAHSQTSLICTQSDLTYPHTVRPHLSAHSQTSLIHTQSDLTYPHTVRPHLSTHSQTSLICTHLFWMIEITMSDLLLCLYDSNTLQVPKYMDW